MANRRDEHDLRGVDLSRLRIDERDLKIDEGSSNTQRIVSLTLIATGIGIVLWLPESGLFKIYGSSLFFTLSLFGTFLGIMGARILWQWAEELAESWQPRVPIKDAGPPSKLSRILMGVGVLAGTIAIVIVEPQATGYDSPAWFFVAGGAITLGILVGRFVLAQAQAADAKPRKEPTFRLPSWFKWVTLSILVTASAVAVVWPLFGTDDSMEFVISAIGLAVGLGVAIWLSQRFDEFDAKNRSQR